MRFGTNRRKSTRIDKLSGGCRVPAAIFVASRCGIIDGLLATALMDQVPELIIGEFRFNRDTDSLHCRDQSVELSPRASQVLECLIGAGVELVSRQAFIDVVWSGNFAVGDHGLRDAIWELRRALNDDPKRPQYIKTVPRKGYRLLQAPRAQAPAKRTRSPRWALLAVAAGLLASVGSISLLLPISQPLQAPLSIESAPVVSGDLTQLAIVRSVANQVDLFVLDGDFDRFGDAVTDANTHQWERARQLTNSVATELSPIWAPNHRDLAFVEHDPANNQCRVRIYFAANGQLETVADDCYVVQSPIPEVPAQLAWSKDGQRLAYQASRRNGVAIASIAVSGDSQPALMTNPGSAIDAFPRFSVSGKLAFLRLHDPMMALAELLVFDPDGEPILQCPEAPIWGLSWADDTVLAATTAMHNPFDLWLYDSVDGVAYRTRSSARFLQAGAVDESLLVDRYAARSKTQQSYPGGREPPSTIGATGPVDYSRASSRLASMVYVEGQWQLRVETPDGTQQTVYRAAEIYRPRFSADGNWIGLSARDDGITENAAVVLISLRTGQIKPQPSISGAVFFAGWAPDGASYYGLTHGIPAPFGGGAVLRRFSLNGSVIETLAEGLSLSVETDRTGALWFADAAGTIYRRAHGERPASAVYALSSAYDSWTIDDQTGDLIVTRSDPARTTIIAISPSGQERELADVAGQIDPVVGLTRGPGQSLLYRRAEHQWIGRVALRISHLVDTVRRGEGLQRCSVHSRLAAHLPPE